MKLGIWFIIMVSLCFKISSLEYEEDLMTKRTFINLFSKTNTNKKFFALSAKSLMFLLEQWKDVLRSRRLYRQYAEWRQRRKIMHYLLHSHLTRITWEDIEKYWSCPGPSQKISILVWDGAWVLVFFNISLGDANV